MKKILYTIGIMVIITFLILIFFNGNIKSSINVSNFSQKEQINTNMVDDYMKLKGDEKKEVENAIKEIAIRDMQIDEWFKYSDDIKMKIYRDDVSDDNEKELFISLNLSKNLGILGIYKLQNGNYLLQDKVENLTNVNKVTVVENRKNKQKFLIIEETLDERVGAYFIDKFIRIFTKKDGKFEEVFRQSKDYEAYYYEKWINPNIEGSKWYKVNEKNKLKYELNEEKSSITVNKKLQKLEGIGGTSSEIPAEFKEIKKEDFNLKFTWSEEYKTFIMGVGKIIATGEEVAVVEDTSKTVDYLLNLGDKYYKVINKNMKTKYVKIDEINLTEDK